MGGKLVERSERKDALIDFSPFLEHVNKKTPLPIEIVYTPWYTTNMNTTALKRKGYFKALVLNPVRMEEACMDYLQLSDVWSLPGLCAYLGTTPNAMKRLFEAFEEDSDDPLDIKYNDDAPPDDSMELLASAIMHIEAKTVENGLTGDFNAHMSKFILSAFHNRNEKQIHESISDSSIQITVQSHQPISLEELKELNRLNEAIDEQTNVELLSMGRSTEDDDDTTEIIDI